ncbi:MAG TPA: type II secretion system protein N [Candidatus Deferrimicrobium sp.]
MRKPVCLAVLGISIVVSAVSLGVTLTRYLGLRAYSPKGTAEAAATPAGRDVPPTPPEQWNNLFAPGDGMKMASRLPVVNVKTASQAPRTSFVLVGTIVSSTPSARRAVLWANGMKEPKAFREKEELEPGAFLASIERDKVWITRGKEREKLEILPVGSRVRPTATAAPTVAPSVAAAVPLSAFPADASTLPWVAPATRPAPDRTQAVAAPQPSSEDEEEGHLTTRGRSRRSRGLRR